MAASRALQIGEILQETFSYFPPPERKALARWRRPSCDNTLASCGRVNRTFHSFAMDVLWRRMFELWPLLRVLPACQWANDDDDGSKLGLFGRLHPDDLHRFQHYARKITVLNLYGDSVFDSSILLCLSRALGDQPLLPRLRILEWKGSSDLTDYHILHVASPSLRTLTLESNAAEPTIISPASPVAVPCEFIFEALCERIAAAAPHLEVLSLTALDRAPYYFAPFANCRSLRTVTIYGGILSASHCVHLQTLSSLPHLSKLSVGSFNMVQDVVPGFQNFDALRELSVSGGSTSIGHVLTAFASLNAAIRSLKIDIEPSCSLRTVGKAVGLMNIVKSRFSSVLEDFTLDGVPLGWSGSAAPPLEPIQPLLDVRNLRTIYFVCHSYPSKLSDGDLCMMATAWPELVSLTLLWQHDRTMGVVTPSLACLSHISRSCPHLKTLKISHMTLTFTGGVDTYPVLSHRLSHLYIEKSASDPQDICVLDVALFLDRLFPNLDAKYLRDSCTKVHRVSDAMVAAWIQVCDQVRGFQAVRMQERKRIAESSGR
ncbi:uncharacterized protein C8Q71DRAFT_862190 [Rhodofomes roseus]|uniref:F-box domain-containing protein n=1 Tax=Rhodofomes roseus TaxID=34475 RepID=A0ABQ8K1W6_9APHY|nr:uncharacterized protein C8Q71DRAFT_862190 [Rhodofomes roseus]KAH9830735.1 hypothetical protein C8Q71DRAFT_862190 [Rhodofomes roseus]